MNYISANEAAEKWGISRERVGVLARQGRIGGAKKVSKYWLIPQNAPNPTLKKQKEPDAGSEHVQFPLALCLTGEQAQDLTVFPEDVQQLYCAQMLVVGCHFEEGYALLTELLSRPQKPIIRVFALYFVCMAQTYLGNVEQFRDAFFEMKLIISSEFPNRMELSHLAGDIESFFSGNEAFLTNKKISPSYAYSKEVLLYMTAVSAYKMMLSKLVTSEPQNPVPLEISCKWIEQEDYIFVAQMLHLYLGLYYLLSKSKEESQYHIRRVLELARTTKNYLYLATYYCFYTKFIDNALDELPDEEASSIRSLMKDYGRHYQKFVNSMSVSPLLFQLTALECKLIYRAFEGKFVKEIADEVNLSVNTINKHYASIYKQMGVKNKTEMVAYYQKMMNHY